MPSNVQSGLEMKYFVLKPRGVDRYAQASRAAMRRYAKLISAVNPEMAAQMMAWADREYMKAAPAIMLRDDDDELDLTDGR